MFTQGRVRAWKYQEKLKLSNTAASTTDILNPRSPDDAEFYRLPLSFSHSALHLLLRQRVKRISQNTQNNGSGWPSLTTRRHNHYEKPEEPVSLAEKSQETTKPELGLTA